MSVSLCDGPTRSALLAVARAHSLAAEVRCRALLGLLRAGERFQEVLRRTPDASILTESGFGILACLGQHEADAITVEKLATELSLAPPVISARLARLEISGFITRERSGEGRHVFVIKITATGRRALASMLSQHLRAIAEVTAPLEAPELASLDLACARIEKAGYESRNRIASAGLDAGDNGPPGEARARDPQPQSRPKAIN